MAQGVWVFFGDHAVSAAPFADNLPGLAQCPHEAVAGEHPDGPLLSGRETVWVSAAILLVALGALVAGT